MRKKRKSGDGGFNVWRSYSDVMAGVLLLFILIMSLTLFQAQKSYDESIQERDEKLALQAEYTADLLAKQNTIEEQEGTIKTKDEKLTALAQTLAEQEAKLKEQQALLNQQQMDLPAVNFSRAVFAIFPAICAESSCETLLPSIGNSCRTHFMFFANAAVSAQMAASSKIHTIGNLTFFMDRPLLSKPFRAAVPSRRLFQFPREVLSLPRHQQAQGN